MSSCSLWLVFFFSRLLAWYCLGSPVLFSHVSYRHDVISQKTYSTHLLQYKSLLSLYLPGPWCAEFCFLQSVSIKENFLNLWFHLLIYWNSTWNIYQCCNKSVAIAKILSIFQCNVHLTIIIINHLTNCSMTWNCRFRIWR